jgi:hypothetical protein
MRRGVLAPHLRTLHTSARPPYGSLRPRQVVASHFRNIHTGGLALLFCVVQYSQYSVMLVLRKSTCVDQFFF